METIDYALPCAALEQYARGNGYFGAQALGPEPVDARMYIEEMAPEVDPVVTGLFDIGDKLFIIAPSKCRKSFFTLQFALSVASGRRFFEWEIPKPRRVLLIQYEIQSRHYHRRVHQLSQSLGISSESLADEQERGRLEILNLRGHHVDWDQIMQQAAGFDLVIIDPFYKVVSEAGADENSSSEVGRILAGCDRLAQESNVVATI